MAECASCGADLSSDDVGLHKKLVNRGAEAGFLCPACLASRFEITLEQILAMRERFRAQGCGLFSPSLFSPAPLPPAPPPTR